MKQTTCYISIFLLFSFYVNYAQPQPRQHADLVWYDEFNDSGEINPAKWERQEYNRRSNDNGPDGWWSREDSYLDGQGNLVIRVRKIDNKNADNDPYDYSTGALRSKGKFEQLYGRFETRCLLPTQQGWWVAFWMMQGNVGSTANGGVDGSEVDIMEGFGWNDKINLAIHYDGYGAEHKSTGNKLDLPGIRNEYHTYALDWFPDKYIFYIDGEEVWRTEGGGVCNRPGYVKLTGEISTQSGLTSTGWANDPAGAIYPDSFLVDYVRIYKFPAAPAPFAETPAAIPGKIEFENYDQGENGIVYHDNTDDNEGEKYRSGDVDINYSTEQGYYVGWTAAGEWLTYSVNSEGFGEYDLVVNSASATTGGAIQLEVNGKDISDIIELPQTSGWNSFQQTTAEKIALPGGKYILKVKVTEGNVNLDYLEFKQRDIRFSLNGLTDDSTSYEIGQPVQIQINASSIHGEITSIGLYHNNDSIGGSVAGEVYTFEYTPKADEQGWNSFLVSIYDASGNQFSYLYTIHVGNMLPTVSIVFPADSSVLYYGREMILKSEAADPDGKITGVELHVNGAFLRKSTTEPHYFDISSIGRGTHNISVVAIDNNNERQKDSISITLADSIQKKNGWSLLSMNGAISSLVSEEGATEVCIEKSTGIVEDVVLSRSLALQPDEVYRLTFAISSEPESDIKMVIKSGSDPSAIIVTDTLHAAAEKDSIAYTFNSGSISENSAIEFYLGQTGQPCLSISDISLDIITSNPGIFLSNNPAIYPNPVSDILHFSYPTDFQIISTTGKLVLEGIKSTEVSTKSLSAGVYLIITNQGSGKIVKR